MSKSRLLVVALALAVALGIGASATASAASYPFNDKAFAALWNRTDLLVAVGALSRSYLWGPAPTTGYRVEEYAETSGGWRVVQYFDKSRMEISNPSGDRGSQYFVSNGLLTTELMTGRLQKGDGTFEQRQPAQIPVAGDNDDTTGPTYATLANLRTATGRNTGQVTQTVDRAGNTTGSINRYSANYVYWVSETGHNIASPFWNYLNQSGAIRNADGRQVTGKLFEPVFYATGFPTTEAYWARVKVAGRVTDVLVQAFERRILTYEPGAPPAYQVQMGNVGLHYYTWRYTADLPATDCLAATKVTANTAQACATRVDGNRAQATARLVINGVGVQGAAVVASWQFAAGVQSCSATTGADGIARCTVPNTATSGQSVGLSVSFTYKSLPFAATATFTP